MNCILAIVIPTYERIESLKTNLFKILTDLQEHSIAIYITDDSRNNDVAKFVSRFKEYHEYIFYRKNEARLGHDANFVRALNQSKADYTWILGDGVGLSRGAIKTILGIIDKNQHDIISVNKLGRDIDFPSGCYSNPSVVFDNFGWHLTYTGATIYSKRVIKVIRSIKMENFKNFPQMALIFTHLSNNCSFCWVNKNLIYGIPTTGSYWANSAFKVFIDDWTLAINNLPDTFSADIKKSNIIKHSKKSNLFNTKFLLKLRLTDSYNSETIKNYNKLLINHSGKNYFFLYIISIIPKWLIILIITIKNGLRRHADKKPIKW